MPLSDILQNAVLTADIISQTVKLAVNLDKQGFTEGYSSPYLISYSSSFHQRLSPEKHFVPLVGSMREVLILILP